MFHFEFRNLSKNFNFSDLQKATKKKYKNNKNKNNNKNNKNNYGNNNYDKKNKIINNLSA